MVVSYNVDKKNSPTIKSVTEHLSEFVGWDVICLQQYTASPKEISGPLFSVGSGAFPQISAPTVLDPATTAVGATPADPPPEDHGNELVIFANGGRFPCAIVLQQALASSLRWHARGDFATAVVLGLGGSPWLILSAYIPHEGHGQDMFNCCIADIDNLIAQASSRFKLAHTAVGCDANTRLKHHPDLENWIGLACDGQLHRERIQTFLDLIMVHELRASSTFLAEDEVSWTHMWYGDSSVKQIIDYVLVSGPCNTKARVAHSVTCLSDHKPVVCEISDLPSLPAPLASPAFEEGLATSRRPGCPCFWELSGQLASRFECV